MQLHKEAALKSDSLDRSLKGRLLDRLSSRNRQALSQARYLFQRRPAELRTLLTRVAARSVVDVLMAYSDFATRPAGFSEFSLRGYRQPVRLRNGTSDFAVFVDVMLRQQYRIRELPQAEYIIDAGANIGLTSLYLLKRYPQAQIIALEPDPENFAIASHNLAPYGERVTLLNAALWSHESRLRISRGTFRDGGHWATQTLPAEDSTDETVPAHTVHTLLQRHVFPRIDLLKVDIEGAELQVFRDGDPTYLGRTRCCAVECHGPECEAAYRAALAPHPFRLSTQSELLVALK